MSDLPSNAPGRRIQALLQDLVRRVSTLEQQSSVPTSGMIWWPGTLDTIPSGWVAAGSSASREQLRGILSIVGTTYGAGNQSTTFDLPDGPPGDPAGGVWIIRA